jgi:hypothetical protein
MVAILFVAIPLAFMTEAKYRVKKLSPNGGSQSGS